MARRHGSPTRSLIRETKRRLARALLDNPGISGVGIDMAADGSERIKVYLAEDSPSVRALVPPVADGYPVVIEVIGPVVARDG